MGHLALQFAKHELDVEALRALALGDDPIYKLYQMTGVSYKDAQRFWNLASEKFDIVRPSAPTV